MLDKMKVLNISWFGEGLGQVSKPFLQCQAQDRALVCNKIEMRIGRNLRLI